MDKSAKNYRRAVINYNEGKLDKAIDNCEKSISLSLRNSASVNLKGLLLYIKGDIEEAEALWRLNKDYNQDEVSKKYLENLESDKRNLLMYEEAEKLIGDMKFKEAFVLLKECCKSDFNAINVNNSLCKVFIHLGRYEEARQCIEKVMSMDRYNKTAKENKNLLIEYRVLSRNYGKKKAAVILAAVFFCGLLLWRVILINNIKEEKKISSQNNNVSNQETVVLKQPPEIEESKKKSEVTDVNGEKADVNKEEHVFPKEELTKAISKKDYNEVYSSLQLINVSQLEASEKVIHSQARQLLKDEGTGYFYASGRELHKKKQYSEAVVQYKKAEKYGLGNYLYPNVVFMLGDCYEVLGETQEAIDYYSTYLNSNYDKEYDYEYNDTILYKLAVIYKDLDLQKSQAYALKLKQQYLESEYNNSVIQDILD